MKVTVRRLPLFLLPFLLLGGIASCTSLSDLEEPENLSQVQAWWVADLMAKVGTNGLIAGMGSPSPTAPLSGPQLIDFARDIDYYQNCGVSGTIDLAGTVSGSINDSGNGSVGIQVTEEINGCVSDTSSGGTFEMNGSPHLTMTGDFRYSEWEPSDLQTLRIQGAFTWEFSRGGSGSCSLELEVVFDGTQGGGTITGTVCNQPVTDAGFSA